MLANQAVILALSSIKAVEFEMKDSVQSSNIYKRKTTPRLDMEFTAAVHQQLGFQPAQSYFRKSEFFLDFVINFSS